MIINHANNRLTNEQDQREHFMLARNNSFVLEEIDDTSPVQDFGNFGRLIRNICTTSPSKYEFVKTIKSPKNNKSPRKNKISVLKSEPISRKRYLFAGDTATREQHADQSILCR